METGSRGYFRFHFFRNRKSKLKFVKKKLNLSTLFQGTKAEVSEVTQLNQGVEEKR